MCLGGLVLLWGAYVWCGYLEYLHGVHVVSLCCAFSVGIWCECVVCMRAVCDVGM